MTTEQRLKRLERENRWMKRLGSVALAAASIVFLVGQGAREELPDLVVRSLMVRDAEGKDRIYLTGSDGRSNLYLFGPKGKAQVVLSASSERAPGTGLLLRDADGPIRAHFAINDSGVAELGLADVNGKVGVSLGESKEGKPTLLLMDGSNRSSLASAGLVMMKDLKLRIVLATGIKKSTSPSLTLHDSTGLLRAALGETITVDKRTGAETKTAENTLTLFGAKGDVIWQAPR